MELEKKSLVELRNLAKELGMQNISKYKKSELIEEIKNRTKLNFDLGSGNLFIGLFASFTSSKIGKIGWK